MMLWTYPMRCGTDSIPSVEEYKIGYGSSCIVDVLKKLREAILLHHNLMQWYLLSNWRVCSPQVILNKSALMVFIPPECLYMMPGFSHYSRQPPLLHHLDTISSEVSFNSPSKFIWDNSRDATEHWGPEPANRLLVSRPLVRRDENHSAI